MKFAGIRPSVWVVFLGVIVMLGIFMPHGRDKKISGENKAVFTTAVQEIQPVRANERQKKESVEEEEQEQTIGKKGVSAETEKDLNRFGLTMSNTVRVVVEKN